MKDNYMKKNILKIFMSCILALSFGCAKKTAPSILNETQFFDIVYVSTQYRAPGGTTWFPTSGLYEMKFLQDTTEGASAIGGTFSMHYTSYLESNLCPYGENCVCSGGLTGLFTDGPKLAEPTTGPYDPSTTYNPGGESGAGTAPTDSNVSKIYTFNFSLNFQVNTLTSGCANGHKFNQPLKVYRFSNGDLIVTNDTSQLYMTPEIKKVN